MGSRGSADGGASTITMQVTKNLYLWPLPSYGRKVLEAPMALIVDLVWSKQRIMEVYLNIAEWGRTARSASRPGRNGLSGAARGISPPAGGLADDEPAQPRQAQCGQALARQAYVAGIVEQRARSAELPMFCFSKEIRP